MIVAHCDARATIKIKKRSLFTAVCSEHGNCGNDRNCGRDEHRRGTRARGLLRRARHARIELARASRAEVDADLVAGRLATVAPHATSDALLRRAVADARSALETLAQIGALVLALHFLALHRRHRRVGDRHALAASGNDVVVENGKVRAAGDRQARRARCILLLILAAAHIVGARRASGGAAGNGGGGAIDGGGGAASGGLGRGGGSGGSGVGGRGGGVEGEVAADTLGGGKGGHIVRILVDNDRLDVGAVSDLEAGQRAGAGPDTSLLGGLAVGGRRGPELILENGGGDGRVLEEMTASVHVVARLGVNVSDDRVGH